jgi:hypothetical protein
MSRSSRTFEIVDTTPAHVEHVAAHMRGSDAAECMAACGMDPLTALSESVAVSAFTKTIVLGGEPAAIFGGADASHRVPGRAGVAWLLGTDAISRHPKAFWQASKAGLAMLLVWSRRLYNYVDARNTTSLRWLERLGARIIRPPVPYGVEGRAFYRFEFGG